MKLWKIACVVLLALSQTGLRADGDVRPATAGEKACMKKVLDLFVRCAAKGPAGWGRTEEGDASVPDSVSGSAGNTPIPLSYEVVWADEDRLEAADQRSMQMMMKQMEAGPSQAQQADQEKLNALMAQLTAAAEKGDYAKVQTLQPEMERLSKRIGEAQQRQLAPAEEARAVKDARLELSLETNATWVQMHGRATPEPALQGAAVYRVNDEGKDSDGWREGTTYAVLGPLKLSSEGDSSYLQSGNLTGAPCKVVTLVVTVRAEKLRARKFLESLDWAALKALMQ